MTLKWQHKTKHTWNKSAKQIFTSSWGFFLVSSWNLLSHAHSPISAPINFWCVSSQGLRQPGQLRNNWDRYSDFTGTTPQRQDCSKLPSTPNPPVLLSAPSTPKDWWCFTQPWSCNIFPSFIFRLHCAPVPHRDFSDTWSSSPQMLTLCVSTYRSTPFF